jgi:hypothetical protein
VLAALAGCGHNGFPVVRQLPAAVGDGAGAGDGAAGQQGRHLGRLLFR